ncbi:MAG: tryptophan synthase subunit alpha [Nitrospirae bacterium]|nr:tryptophan synthase subunit alpha [Nitrospirota bacterium]
MRSIKEAFNNIKGSGRKALITYIMAGDPSLNATKKHIIALEKSGADIIELGVPFSDPLADGPTIQRASERALAKKITLRKVLGFVAEIRKATDIPIILMTYYNPVFKFGVEKFVRAAVTAGVNGIIVPDLIPDEAGDLIREARTHNLDTIFLLAPTSTPERIRKAARASTGFIYYVSITGTTGAKLLIDPRMRKTLNSIKNISGKPLAVGFGISTPKEASSVSLLADGVIVGSAIVKLIGEGKKVTKFVRSLRKAV